MAHTCSSILFHCMDFRLTNEIRNWLETEGLMGDSDIVSLAGAAKELVDGTDGAKGLLLKQIKISKDLHKACRVILMHHTQCGAYAASYKFASEEEEITKHKEDLALAEKAIKESFPDLEVLKVIANMKDDAGNMVEFVKV
jgi:carbonic anhydrase